MNDIQAKVESELPKGLFSFFAGLTVDEADALNKLDAGLVSKLYQAGVAFGVRMAIDVYQEGRHE